MPQDIEKQLAELGQRVRPEPGFVPAVMKRVGQTAIEPRGRNWLVMAGMLAAACVVVGLVVMWARHKPAASGPQIAHRSASPATVPAEAIASENQDLAVDKGRWGFIDSTGKVVVEAQFSAVRQFSDGLAAVRVGEKWGYIDKTGKVVVPARYEFGLEFSEGLAPVRVGDKWGYIDAKSDMKIAPRFDVAYSFSEKRAVFRIGGDGMGYIDQEGKVAVRQGLEEVGRFSEGLAHARVRGGKTGFIDPEGNWVVPPTLDSAGTFENGLAPANQGDRHGFIDKQGKWIIQTPYQPLSPFRDGRARVSFDGRDQIAYIDKAGRLVAGPLKLYEHGLLLQDQKLVAAFDGPGGGLQTDPNIDPQRLWWDHDLVRISTGVGRGARYGFADRELRVVIPPIFERVGPFSEGLAPYAVDAE